MTYLLEWAKELLLVSAGFAFAELLVPSGQMAKYIKFIFSIIILSILLDPIRLLL